MTTSALKSKSAFELQLAGYGLTTAKVFYHMPDHPHLLQLFVWQDYDFAPEFPVLNHFIEFWQREIEGPLHSVSYTHFRLLGASDWRNVQGEIVLH
ncbi:usg protein [Brucella inopinata]|uniref:Usg protein n=1 Tax=Brucella inopinata TaxID=1218315 RepID=A0AAW7AXQ2_9HYPH|nr:usg protein [Brucella inopinata]EFM56732.1 usg protein [Brucella inopinata BO1]KEY04921.1 Usg family protein [Brucella suis bv. 4 str. 40]MDL2331705.1 usg protein [Brucella inopinata]